MGETIHPQVKYLPGSEQAIPVSSSAQETSPEPLKGLENYKDRLTQLTKIYQVGKRQGKKEEMFGRIEGIVNDDEGNMYVLDSNHNQIKVFDVEGTFLYSIGSGGPGPGEFQSPVDIEMGSNGNVFVADRANAIHIFSPADKGYEYKTTLKIFHTPDKFCLMNDVLFIRGVGVNRNSEDSTKFNIIHKYSTEGGKYLGSFGEPYNSPNNLVKQQLSNGQIGCIQANNTIITTFDGMPFLFAYSSDGEFKWKAEIKPFNARTIVEEIKEGKPAITFKKMDNPIDVINLITPLKNSGLFYVQVSHFLPNEYDPSQSWIRTFLISAEDGSSRYINKELPPILSANRNNLYVNAISDSLFPNIIAYNY